jgi:hypothetical protein
MTNNLLQGPPNSLDSKFIHGLRPNQEGAQLVDEEEE